MPARSPPRPRAPPASTPGPTPPLSPNPAQGEGLLLGPQAAATAAGGGRGSLQGATRAPGCIREGAPRGIAGGAGGGRGPLTSSVRISCWVRSLDTAHLVRSPRRLPMEMSMSFWSCPHCCSARLAAAPGPPSAAAAAPPPRPSFFSPIAAARSAALSMPRHRGRWVAEAGGARGARAPRGGGGEGRTMSAPRHRRSPDARPAGRPARRSRQPSRGGKAKAAATRRLRLPELLSGSGGRVRAAGHAGTCSPRRAPAARPAPSGPASAPGARRARPSPWPRAPVVRERPAPALREWPLHASSSPGRPEPGGPRLPAPLHSCLGPRGFPRPPDGAGQGPGAPGCEEGALPAILPQGPNPGRWGQGRFQNFCVGLGAAI